MVKVSRLHLGLRIPVLKRQVYVILLCLSEGLKKNWVMYGKKKLGISLRFYIKKKKRGEVIDIWAFIPVPHTYMTAFVEKMTLET
jgi:hypothetical protein